MSSPAIAAAYRVNWNPQLAPNDVTEEDVRKLEREGVVKFHWRCGRARIEPNQRIFLVRTGKGPRGIIGVGRSVSEPDGGREVDGDWEPFAVKVRFHMLSLEPIVDRSALDTPPLDGVHWSNATAAARLTAEQANALEALIAVARPRHPLPRLQVVDVEAALTLAGSNGGRSPGTFERTESVLVHRYKEYRAAQGVRLRALIFQPDDWPTALRCDLYDERDHRVIEAKADADRASIRMAIGQLADYARLHGQPRGKAVLLPERPHPDLLDLLKSAQIDAIWKSGDGFEDSTGGRLIRRQSES